MDPLFWFQYCGKLQSKDQHIIACVLDWVSLFFLTKENKKAFVFVSRNQKSGRGRDEAEIEGFHTKTKPPREHESNRLKVETPRFKLETPLPILRYNISLSHTHAPRISHLHYQSPLFLQFLRIILFSCYLSFQFGASQLRSMPQVDIESLVSACAGGSTDRKIACEPLPDDDNPSHGEDRPEAHPDSPPESVWLSRDEEFDWWDRNAIYERKESTKGNSMSVHSNATSNSNSQRFSVNFKSKAAIIGLPKPQKTTFVDVKNRRSYKPGTARLFPKRYASVGKSENSVVEPSSPKVSCMGKVRSKKDRSRRLRTRQRSFSDSAPAQEKSARSGRRKPGFFESFRAIFRSNNREKSVQKSDHPPADSPPRTKRKNKKPSGKNEASFAEAIPRSSLESEPPSLGGMTRFASGRRSESWGLSDSEIHVAPQNRPR